MRNYRFRGKVLATGEWEYGSLEVLKEPLQVFIVTWNGETFKVDPKTVGQYIDTNDKDGLEAFEGDISRAKIGESGIVGVGAISFENGRFKATYPLGEHHSYGPAMASHDFKVIGNIHDNPELLED